MNEKVSFVISDAIEVSIGFDKSGKAILNEKNEYKTKREMKDSYGMASYGSDNNADGKVLEWYKQADVFDNICIGKNASEIVALNVGGYGSESVQSAGCTIKVYTLTKAVEKSLRGA